ncbi:MAG: hypothetical protein HY606_15635 [Planctomycetes bacterium]|nr:hypothetical protein [Planctomycetota bacterium]
MPRFSLAYHFGWKHHKKHYDLFIETRDHLETYSFKKLSDKQIILKTKQRHRKKYLLYEGTISKNRGCITIVKNGNYITKNKNLLALYGLGIINKKTKELTLER